MAKILIVDDEPLIVSLLSDKLESEGFETFSALSLKEGIFIAKNHPIDIVLLDVYLPDGNGLENIPSFSGADSAPEIIIMTGEGELAGAKKAIEYGAWSYIEKTGIASELILPLTRALDYRKEKKAVKIKNIALNRENIIGNSRKINKCIEQIATTTNTDGNVLITGESGTGKELFARAVHENSLRASGPFIVVDCASLPDSLIESALFGHQKGSFTGADRDQIGLIKTAHNGSLFLDEVGELPIETQKKLLRVIQEGSFRKIGSTQESTSNFRVIAATNRDLDAMCEKSQFRTDLLFRLRSFHINLPPLAERDDDIVLLANYFIAKLCNNLNIDIKSLSTDFIASMHSYHWPGNVRELQQVLGEVCALAYHHRVLFSYHLPERMRVELMQKDLKISHKDGKKNVQQRFSKPLLWKEYKLITEKEYLFQLMHYTSNDIYKACEISGLSRARIYQLLKKQGITV